MNLNELAPGETGVIIEVDKSALSYGCATSGLSNIRLSNACSARRSADCPPT